VGPASCLPSVFCWTKIQTEAGQPLEVIVRRKELERSIGEGVFYWGIGNALGRGLGELLSRTSQPEVLFSIMKSRPKKEDVEPTSVLLWTKYIDDAGISRSLPTHALVLSRGHTLSGEKRRHYALVCHSDTQLKLASLGSLALAHFKNLGGDNRQVGFSQVTATVFHDPAGTHTGPYYEVALRTALTPPYHVRLAEPIPLSEEGRTAILAALATNATPDSWRRLVVDIRGREGFFDRTPLGCLGC